MRLSLTLLGAFQITLDGEPVTGFESDKVQALLVYLALEADRPHRRDTLAEMFWPDRLPSFSLTVKDQVAQPAPGADPNQRCSIRCSRRRRR